jgi:hypothetical protein
VANDGQTPILANQDFGGFNLTNLGTASGVTGTFSGTVTAVNFVGSTNGGRFRANFSSATSAQFLFQSTTANGNTFIGAIPNGSSTSSFFDAYGAADPDNAPIIRFGTEGTGHYINSIKTGTGTLVGFRFLMNGVQNAIFDTAGVWTFSSSPLIPTAAPGDNSSKAASTAFVAAVDALVLHKAGIETITAVKTFQTGSEPVGKNLPKAWCRFNGTTAGTNAPTAGYNVTSVTRNGVGDYTINFTVNMADANYCVSGMVGYSGNSGCWLNVARSVTATPLAVGSARILTNVSGSPVDAEIVCAEILANN